jgi:hypothetical protein
MMNGRGPEAEGYGGDGGLWWLCPQSYGLWNVREESRVKGRRTPWLKKDKLPPLHDDILPPPLPPPPASPFSTSVAPLLRVRVCDESYW